MADHRALFYRSEPEHLEGVQRFVAPALRRGAPVAIAAPGNSHGYLSDGLGEAAGMVQLIDMSRLGRNPGRIISAIHELAVQSASQSRPLHFVGEPIWAGRSRDEIAEAYTHEALINLAFKGCPVRILCPYDFARLDDAVIAAARRTHPMIVDPAGQRVSPEYMPPSDPHPWEDPLPDPPAGAARIRFSLQTLRKLRTLVTEYAARAGVDRCRRDDLVLAASELATNSIEHAGGSGELSIWTAGDKLVCEIRDRGHIADPLAGRIRPAPESASGRGLWLVHQLCELVQTRSSEHGTVVRLQVSRDRVAV